MSNIIASAPPPIHSDSSSLRPHVKPIKELTNPTTITDSTPLDLGLKFEPSSVPDTSDMRESLSPQLPMGTGTPSAINFQNTIIGLIVGIILAVTLTAAAICMMAVKLRRIKKKKDEEAAAELQGEKGQDSKEVSPAPPRYSPQDPVVGEIVLPPVYLEPRKSDDKNPDEKNPEGLGMGDHENDQVAMYNMGREDHQGGSMTSLRNMRILV